jgi:transposase-like protein
MMKGETMTKRRIEIVVEKHRVLTVRTRRISAVGWCAPCGMKVRMVTAEDASRIAKVTLRTVYRWAEAGQLHFTESQDGLLLVCVNSLD